MTNPAVQTLRRGMAVLTDQAAAARAKSQELQGLLDAQNAEIANYDSQIAAHRDAITTLGEVP